MQISAEVINTRLDLHGSSRALCLRELVELAAGQSWKKVHFAGVVHLGSQSGSDDFAIYSYGDFWADLILLVTYPCFKARIVCVEMVNYLPDCLTIGWNLSLSVGQFLHEWRDPSNGHNRRLSRAALRPCRALR